MTTSGNEFDPGASRGDLPSGDGGQSHHEPFDADDRLREVPEGEKAGRGRRQSREDGRPSFVMVRFGVLEKPALEEELIRPPGLADPVPCPCDTVCPCVPDDPCSCDEVGCPAFAPPCSGDFIDCPTDAEPCSGDVIDCPTDAEPCSGDVIDCPTDAEPCSCAVDSPGGGCSRTIWWAPCY